MEYVDIAILYEKAARELDVACVIKYLAKQQHGLNVEIVQWPYGFQQAHRLFRPKVVVLPFHYRVMGQEYLYGWQGSIFFNFTWEQLFYSGNIKAKTPRGSFVTDHLIHHAWSDEYAGLLRRQGVPSERIFINGHPAYALYDEPYRRYFKQRSDLALQYGLDPSKKWIFFPENYNWAFYSQAMLQQMITDGQPPDQVFAMRDYAYRSFEAVIKWCETLAKRDGIELVIRPRPATLVEDFVARVLEVISALPDHMHILHQESVREWIMASDVVVSSYSTSLIEASIANKAIYILEPYPIPKSLRQDWHRLVPRVTSEVEFLNVCLNRSGRLAHDRLGTWARSTLLARGDPIQNVVDQLAKICRGESLLPPTPTWQSVTPDVGRPLPRWLIYAYYRLYFEVLRWAPPYFVYWYRRLRGRKPVVGVDPEYEADMVDQDEIQRRVRRWEHVFTDPLANK